ncbi:hypothetical protein HH214_03450 [Mucilaginibacter robiniae]|uniref:IPT/TIG domain-containing protein n=1 Tax=Mucilaginibacter robiniae TaxID=2728022 RepID=A0A7L5DW78_9SPHI|nr:hypothetical protein [Mucilaginibacter robiniae]QJD95001.1 hypothetical protein HH214_03450 [Mucilaginibacter robiniae]
MFTLTISKKAAGLLLSVFLLLLFSCKKDSNKLEEKNAPTETANPVIGGIWQYTAFNSSGKPFYTLAISGINFKKDFKNYKVLFNDLTANAIAGDSLQFVVNIPDAAVTTESTLTIVMDGKSTIYGKPFKVEQIEPTIANLNTEAGMRGSKLVITGTYFSPVPSENMVMLNGVKIAIDSLKSSNYEGSTSGGVVNGNIYQGVNRNLYTGRVINVTIPPNASTGKLVVTSYGKSVTYSNDVNVLSSTFTSFPSTILKSISFDGAGNMYGTVKNTVVKVTPGGGINTLATIGDKDFILGDCVADAAGNVYVASGDDYTLLPSGPHNLPLYRITENSSKVYKITPGGAVSVFAGSTNGLADGQGTDAKFRSPTHIVRNAKTGDLYVSDALVIRKITANGTVSTLAGSNNPAGSSYTNGLKDGQGTAASFLYIYSMLCDASTGDLYVIDDSYLGNLRKVTAGGYVSTIKITVPYYNVISFNTVGMAIDASNNILISTYDKIYKIKDGMVSDMHLNPFGEAIYGMALDGSNNIYLNTAKTLYKILP